MPNGFVASGYSNLGGGVTIPSGYSSTGGMSFDGGGFTGFGNRVGGIDGKGGFPAVLHPNETVIDHTKNGFSALKASSATPNVSVNVINNTGTQASAQQQGSPKFDGEKWVLSVVLNAANTNPNFRSALGVA